MWIYQKQQEDVSEQSQFVDLSEATCGFIRTEVLFQFARSSLFVGDFRYTGCADPF